MSNSGNFPDFKKENKELQSGVFNPGRFTGTLAQQGVRKTIGTKLSVDHKQGMIGRNPPSQFINTNIIRQLMFENANRMPPNIVAPYAIPTQNPTTASANVNLRSNMDYYRSNYNPQNYTKHIISRLKPSLSENNILDYNQKLFFNDPKNSQNYDLAQQNPLRSDFKNTMNFPGYEQLFSNYPNKAFASNKLDTSINHGNMTNKTFMKPSFTYSKHSDTTTNKPKNAETLKSRVKAKRRARPKQSEKKSDSQASTGPMSETKEKKKKSSSPAPDIPVAKPIRKSIFTPKKNRLKSQFSSYSMEELLLKKKKIDHELTEIQKQAGKMIKKIEIDILNRQDLWSKTLKEGEKFQKIFFENINQRESLMKKTCKLIQCHKKKSVEIKKKKVIYGERKRKQLAKSIAKLVNTGFWNKIRKLNEIKNNWREEEEKRNLFKERLDSFVEQSSSLTSSIAKNLHKSNYQNKSSEIEKMLKSVADEEKQKNMVQVPVGISIETCPIQTEISSLLRYGTLRDYQRIGVDWLITLHKNKLNGILADEMGLGKTVQTIALFAYLAEQEENWGPHLLVVPTSVLVNWEMEFKRWLPGFKVISYYGSAKERKEKRRGIQSTNEFHVLITSYNLAVTDAKSLARQPWEYLVLDEAHNIKNFQSKKWQAMLGLKSNDRLLLTGTPLQNNVMELWAFLHFLMPTLFASRLEFTQWFDCPMSELLKRNQALSNSPVVQSLHSILRPFMLRRLKEEVATQLPKKKELVVKCKLSPRQRKLYEEFMNEATTRDILERENLYGMWSVLMQLRKVCNHPDLFEGRPILSPFEMPSVTSGVASLPPVLKVESLASTFDAPFSSLCGELNRFLCENEGVLGGEGKAPACDVVSTTHASESLHRLRPGRGRIASSALRQTQTASPVQSRAKSEPIGEESVSSVRGVKRLLWGGDSNEGSSALALEKKVALEKALTLEDKNNKKFSKNLFVGENVIRLLYLRKKLLEAINEKPLLKEAIKTPLTRSRKMKKTIDQFVCVNPPARASGGRSQAETLSDSSSLNENFLKLIEPYHSTQLRMSMNFPDKKLIQWDCGKLQKLSKLLHDHKQAGDRVLIFTQMTKMLDVLEAFLNIYDYRYFRLDGSTRTDQRGFLMERFNTDRSIFVFILTTRSGGYGINLTGANVVIFYDTDWNPAIDMQAQDRAHRIGQTREVTIYRLISANTVEENMFQVALNKRKMNAAVIGDGNFNTESLLGNSDIREMFGLKAKEKKNHLKEDRDDRDKGKVSGESDDDVSPETVSRLMYEAEDPEDQKQYRQAVNEMKVQSLTAKDYTEQLESELNETELYALNFDKSWVSISGFTGSADQCDLPRDQFESPGTSLNDQFYHSLTRKAKADPDFSKSESETGRKPVNTEGGDVQRQKQFKKSKKGEDKNKPKRKITENDREEKDNKTKPKKKLFKETEHIDSLEYPGLKAERQFKKEVASSGKHSKKTLKYSDKLIVKELKEADSEKTEDEIEGLETERQISDSQIGFKDEDEDENEDKDEDEDDDQDKDENKNENENENENENSTVLIKKQPKGKEIKLGHEDPADGKDTEDPSSLLSRKFVSLSRKNQHKLMIYFLKEFRSLGFYVHNKIINSFSEFHFPNPYDMSSTEDAIFFSLSKATKFMRLDDSDDSNLKKIALEDKNEVECSHAETSDSVEVSKSESLIKNEETPEGAGKKNKDVVRGAPLSLQGGSEIEAKEKDTPNQRETGPEKAIGHEDCSEKDCGLGFGRNKTSPLFGNLKERKPIVAFDDDLEFENFAFDSLFPIEENMHKINQKVQIRKTYLKEDIEAKVNYEWSSCSVLCDKKPGQDQQHKDAKRKHAKSVGRKKPTKKIRKANRNRKQSDYPKITVREVLIKIPFKYLLKKYPKKFKSIKRPELATPTPNVHQQPEGKANVITALKTPMPRTLPLNRNIRFDNKPLIRDINFNKNLLEKSFPESQQSELEHKVPVFWTKREDECLKTFVSSYGPNWKLISETLNFDSVLSGRLRSAKDCETRFLILKEQKLKTKLRSKEGVRAIKLFELQKHNVEKKQKSSFQVAESFLFENNNVPVEFGSVKMRPFLQRAIEAVEKHRKACDNAFNTTLKKDAANSMNGTKVHTSHEEILADTRASLGISKINNSFVYMKLAEKQFRNPTIKKEPPIEKAIFHKSAERSELNEMKSIALRIYKDPSSIIMMNKYNNALHNFVDFATAKYPNLKSCIREFAGNNGLMVEKIRSLAHHYLKSLEEIKM